MFLKSLTLKGFKSFAETTTLELEPGVTVVVGPNGSGKSNVVDAIAWVLGAQAPSAVRSQKMDDVIFAGTAKRPALGRAEVTLTIDNSAGLLPIAFTEVTVTRTLYRSGDSEYALNGVPCRLLDVQELLSDTGVGRQQHTIVSQGQIDGVLNARPEDRRLVIEEAAGILKYRRRKEKAERRLAATEANLTRVHDLLREVRRQLRPLERQAEAARRHGGLVDELVSLRRHLAGRELAALGARLEAAARTKAASANDERTLKQQLARLDAEIVATEAQLGATGGDDLGDALRRWESLRERARGLAAVLVERRRGIERDRGASVDAAVVATLEAEAARLAGDLDGVEAEARGLAPAAERLAAAEADLAEERAAFETMWASGVTPPSGMAAETRGELAALRSGLGQAAAELARVGGRVAALEAKAARLDAEAARLRAELDQAADAEVPLVDRLATAEQRRVAAEAAADQAEQVVRAAEADRHAWAARADALAQALDEARARAGAAALAEIDGVVGTLLDLVDVDAGYEAAFEAAAGEALHAVVVDDVGAARRALAALHEGDATGAVVALDTGGASQLAFVPALGEPLRGHVRGARPAVEQLLDLLVGGAVVVEGGWEEALEAALAHPGNVIVTGAGDRFAPSGWRVGAAGTGATGAALDEARTRAAAAGEAADRAGAALALARHELAAARDDEGAVGRALDENDARLAAAGDGLQRVDADRRDTATETDALREHLADLGARTERQEARAAELDGLLPSLEADEQESFERGRVMTDTRAHLDERAAAVGALRTDLEVRAAALDERRNLCRRRLGEVEEQLARNVAARDAAAATRRRIEHELEAVDRLSSLVAARVAAIEARTADLLARRNRQSAQARAVATHLDGLRQRRTAAERSLDEVRERARRAELDEAETRLRLQAATEQCRRELDCEPSAAMAAACPPLPEGTTPAARVRELERELRLLGPVNPLAVEEYEALQARHEFLQGQLDDVKATRRDLSRVIRAVNDEIVRVFAAAYADVAENFSQLFETLFPGGRGQLRLTAPDDLLETGIEVEARPSGKNVRKLSLLSGGERSLTALAFLFAVFRSRPSPFYVMDEVEAALDDVNLHRFLELLNEFRAEAQLVIVSHQKRTMEAADCLYGVTMAPGGSSRVISERVTATT